MLCEEEDDEDDECVLKGKSTSLSAYFRVARNMMSMVFKEKFEANPGGDQQPELRDVEDEFWRLVQERDCHMQVLDNFLVIFKLCAFVGIAKKNMFLIRTWLNDTNMPQCKRLKKNSKTVKVALKMRLSSVARVPNNSSASCRDLGSPR